MKETNEDKSEPRQLPKMKRNLDFSVATRTTPKGASSQDKDACCSQEAKASNSSCSESQQTTKTKTSCCGDDGCEISQDVKTVTKVTESPDAGYSASSVEKTSCCNDENCVSTQTHATAAPSKIEGTKGISKTYLVHGMDCPACAATIEKSLGQMDDVLQASVNYSTAKLQVAVADPSVLQKIPQELKKLGYTAEPVEISRNVRNYRIEGMDCTSCALTLENHFKNHPSVKSVSVQFSSATMKIEHDNDVADIIRDVSKFGYKAFPVSNRRGQTESTPVKSASSSIYLTGALIAFGYIGSLAGVSAILSILLYAVSMIIAGYKPAKSAFYAIKSKSLDMNVLMTAAALGAAFIGEWLEGATVVWLFAVGNMLQTRSIDKTRNTIRSLMDLAPVDAWLKTSSGLTRTPVEDITIGDYIVVKPGEKIPLDGEVVEGLSMVNQAPITGESVPVDKEPGSIVYAGSLNENGSLEIRVTKLVEDTAVARIIHMVEEAQDKKAPTQTFVDQFAHIYTPVVFIIALLLMSLPPIIGLGTWSEWFYKGLELLVVACPCALVISTPVAIVSAIGNAAKKGVLIKGGASLEVAGKINAIAFDKTGTLTEGKPKVATIIGFGVPEEEIVAVARTIEEHSKHPIAEAIVLYAKEKQISSRDGEGFQAILGKGATATLNGQKYYAGNARLFQELNVPLTPIEDHLSELQNAGNTLVIVGTSERLLGIIAVSDTIRSVSTEAIKKLKGVGILQSVMLTGDNEGTAAKISRQAGVDRYFAELLPENKVEAIQKMQQEGFRIAMVGDGINDAPALASANLGIAMGGAGTDTAMETADIVLMADNLERLPYTVELSRKALAVIKQNIWFSLVVKAIALLLIFPGWLTLWIAVLSDTGAAIVVILNSMRLLRMK